MCEAETDGRSITPKQCQEFILGLNRSRKFPRPRSTQSYFRSTAGLSPQILSSPVPIATGNHTNDAAAVSGTLRETRTKNTRSIDPMFPKYTRSKSPFPPLVTDPSTGDPGTTDGLGLAIGSTGAIPWQALTVRENNETSAFAHLYEQRKPHAPSRAQGNRGSARHPSTT